MIVKLNLRKRPLKRKFSDGLIAQIIAVAMIVAALLVLGAGTAHAGGGTAHADKYLQRVETSPAKKTSKKVSSKSTKGKKVSSKSSLKNSKKKTASKDASESKEDKSLSRDMVFTGTDVNGKYLSAGESMTTVESEKSLNQLIGMRKDFKDRMAVDKASLKSTEVK
jgi:major membrane immunogen (membrane-anchored lipoprotein)